MTQSSGGLARLVAAGRRYFERSVHRLRPSRIPSRRRFVRVGDASDRYLEAARRYPTGLAEGEKRWLYRKPLDPSPGNAALFEVLLPVLNLLQAMQIRPGGRVVEVGSGPGWLTEWLMVLGFEVLGIEPAAEMISIAEQRVGAARSRYGLGEHEPSVSFVEATLEEWQAPPEHFDAVIFHEALHHLVDERAGLETAFSALVPGGVLGITEAAWSPGFADTESLTVEMKRFGTLESPFTPEYLDYLLRDIGWQDIRRYHAIPGYVPEHRAFRMLAKEALRAQLGLFNHLVAIKPAGAAPEQERPHITDSTE